MRWQPHIVLLILVAGIAACRGGDSATSGDTTVTFRVLQTGTLASAAPDLPMRQRGYTWITQPERWQTLRAAMAPAGEATIDFERELALGVFLGEQPTGGYGVRVVGMTWSGRDRRLDVDLELVEPDPDAMTIQVITYPYAVIAVPRPPLMTPADPLPEVRFHVRTADGRHDYPLPRLP